MTNLIAAVNPEEFTAKDQCWLNPTFGNASNLVGGADADLIIDDTLIEIKTTKDFKLARHDYSQVMGYYVLSEIWNEGGDDTPKPKISKIDIYFSRYGYLHTMPVRKLAPEFLNWFKQKARQHMCS